MNLINQLKTLKGEDIVAIATENGSSFLYIGRADNTELIEKLFLDQLPSMEHIIEVSDRYLTQLLVHPVKLKDDNELVNKENIYHTASIISDVYGKLVKQRKSINTRVLERNVVEVYHKDVDNCTAIIIEGFENGKFWFKREFDERYNIC